MIHWWACCVSAVSVVGALLWEFYPTNAPAGFDNIGEPLDFSPGRPIRVGSTLPIIETVPGVGTVASVGMSAYWELSRKQFENDRRYGLNASTSAMVYKMDWSDFGR